MRDLFEDLKFTKGKQRLFGVVILLWLGIIISSGAGVNPFPWSWDFSNPGGFGDSFAPFSALMASIAAVGALAAYNSQAEELRRVKERQADADRIAASDRTRALSREREADDRALTQSFEATFFQLLNAFSEKVKSLDITQAGHTFQGHDVFRKLLHVFKDQALDGKRAAKEIEKEWPVFAEKYKNEFNHYFRLLYHIYRFIGISEIRNRYFYAQILRAVLSDAELSFISINCAHGEGKEKFKTLVEEFAVLHNISDAERKYWRLKSKFRPGAFCKANELSEDFEIIEPDLD